MPPFLIPERQVMLFNDSLERCAQEPGFLAKFYERFVASSPEIPPYFEGVDMKRQAALLKVSLYMMVLAAWARPEGNAHLERIARLHGRNGRNIRPELYDLWLSCLLATVREFDADCDAEVEGAWRLMLSRGIEFMRSRYEG